MTFIRTRLFGKKIVIFKEIDEAEEEEEDNFDCGAINSQFAQPKLKVLKYIILNILNLRFDWTCQKIRKTTSNPKTIKIHSIWWIHTYENEKQFGKCNQIRSPFQNCWNLEIVICVDRESQLRNYELIFNFDIKSGTTRWNKNINIFLFI